MNMCVAAVSIDVPAGPVMTAGRRQFILSQVVIQTVLVGGLAILCMHASGWRTLVDMRSSFAAALAALLAFSSTSLDLVASGTYLLLSLRIRERLEFELAYQSVGTLAEYSLVLAELAYPFILSTMLAASSISLGFSPPLYFLSP
jgi:hypothetical protein